MVFFWPFWWVNGYGAFALLWNLIGIGLFILSFYLFVHYGFGLWRWGKRQDSSAACEILKHRYASGEITREEYEQIKRDLGCK